MDKHFLKVAMQWLTRVDESTTYDLKKGMEELCHLSIWMIQNTTRAMDSLPGRDRNC